MLKFLTQSKYSMENKIHNSHDNFEWVNFRQKWLKTTYVTKISTTYKKKVVKYKEKIVPFSYYYFRVIRTILFFYIYISLLWFTWLLGFIAWKIPTSIISIWILSALAKIMVYIMYIIACLFKIKQDENKFSGVLKNFREY